MDRTLALQTLETVYARMLKCTQEGDWTGLLSLEEAVRPLSQSLIAEPAPALPSPEQTALIHRILVHDQAIQQAVRERQSALTRDAGDAGRERKVRAAYQG